MIDLGTAPLGHALPDITLDLDRLDFLVAALPITELPVVLGAYSPYDRAEQRAAAVERGRAGMSADGLLAGGRVHPDVAARVRVLERPDWYLSARLASRPYAEDAAVTRICLSGNSIGTVIAERRDDTLFLRAVAGHEAGALLTALGRGHTFDFRGVSAPTDLLAEALDAAPTDAPGTAARLTHLGIDATTALEVASALGACAAHAEITAVTVGPGTRTPHPHPVSFFDTHRGRIVATSSMAADGRAWSSLAPGTDARILAALAEMISRVKN
ncbi:MAG: ESX secretion-associated protein EspG [Rhodococcus sp. (in: high G+C Gram-positive bacteria)]